MKKIFHYTSISNLTQLGHNDVTHSAFPNIPRKYQVDMATMVGRVFIYGGRGALGAACVAHFKTQNWVRMKYLQVFYEMVTTKA